ncbi:Crf1p [Saccharomyces paradoxus]|uniref:Crf1p n=1 Tax=Saccharomyces paradoxus TaxID=27291 RepID=A0A8B8UNU2_SACPA|nr:Crf1 [Saccharomyces paradoxus]QHS72423.1 Crf1 [Saccharomyces paradoxus]
MLLSVPIKSTVRRKPHIPNKKTPKETSITASCPPTSSTILFSSDNDGSFDAFMDQSISNVSNFESSYTNAKRLKSESNNRRKNRSYKFSRKENINEVEEEASLGDSSKTEADNIFNDQLMSAGRSTYISNKRDVNFGANAAVELLGSPTSKSESHRQYHTTSASKINQDEEDIGVSILIDDPSDSCQTASINNDRPITFQYPETESDIDFDETVIFTPMDGTNKEAKNSRPFKKNSGSDFEERTLLNLDDGRFSECNHFSTLDVSDISHLNENLHKINEVELDRPVDHILSLDNVAINVKKRDTDYLYISSREELYDSSCSSEDPANDSYDSDRNIQEVIYRDDESTDEDESLPTPDRKRKKIGSKACEILDSRRVGIKVPKLHVWSLSGKPFSVIDGLCTKSLYQLGDDIGTPGSLSSGSSSANSQGEQKENPTFDNDAMIADLLNIGGLEVEKVSNGHNDPMGEEFLDIPKGSLSPFRGRNDRLQETDALYDLKNTRVQ